MTTTYEVEKFGRGNKGQWFGFGARRLATLAEATTYLESFAEEQSAVLGAGIRIVLRTRKGRRTLAEVGGRDSGCRTAIRWAEGAR